MSCLSFSLDSIVASWPRMCIHALQASDRQNPVSSACSLWSFSLSEALSEVVRVQNSRPGLLIWLDSP